jgi:hypothetical protein
LQLGHSALKAKPLPAFSPVSFPHFQQRIFHSCKGNISKTLLIRSTTVKKKLLVNFYTFPQGALYEEI